MENIDDDDFGDLYADVEFQASTTINGASNFSEFHIEQDDNNVKCVDEVIEDAEAKEALSVDNESDSEDDLNIVLNDDDDDGGGASVFPVGPGGEFEEDEEEDGGVEADQPPLGDGLELSPSARGCAGEKGSGSKGNYQSQHSQYKYIRPRGASFPTNAKANGFTGVATYSSTSVRGDRDDYKCNQHVASGSLAAQSGHNFSLPWYRTILDVNIDALERKQWRHPGADKTDFFNFDLDEESWKHYCNGLDQLRQQTSLLTRTPVYGFSKAKKVYEAGAEDETGGHKDERKKVSHIRQRGAVSPVSRIAYEELEEFERPKGREIQVEDSILERQPSMDVRRLVDRDPDVVIQIAVKGSMGDSSGSDKEELTHKGSAHEAFENGHFSKRCSSLTTPSSPVSVDSNNHGSGQISDVDGHCNQKVTCASSDGNAEVMETSINTNKKICSDTCHAAPSESLLGDQTQHDQSLSCSGSHFEASRDGSHTDPERFQNHLRRKSPNSEGKLQESVSKIHHGRSKTRDCKFYGRNRRPIPQDLKHYSRRLHNDSELKRHHDYDDSFHYLNTGDAFYSSVGCSRQDKRLNGFESYGGEDVPYYMDPEHSLSYLGGRVSYNEIHASYSKKPRRNRQCFRNETDRYLSSWNEGEYFLEQRMSRGDDEVIARDWHHYERGFPMNPVICKESRGKVSKYSSLDKERVARWRRRGEFQFRQRAEDEFSLDSKNEDDLMQEKYGYYDRERNYVDGMYERHFPSTRTGERNSGRNERNCNTPSIDLDNSWGMSNEDEYWGYTDHRSLSSRSGREPHTANRGRGLQRNGRHNRRRISMGRSRGSDWFGSNHDAGDTKGKVNYPVGQVHFGRRRHWQYESLHCSKDEYFYRYENDEFLTEDASFSFGRTSRRKTFGGKQKLIDDVEVEPHRIKLMREGSSNNRIESNSNVIHEGNHIKPLLRCRDSVDLQLVVGEGKPSGSFSNAGSMKCNDEDDYMDQIISADHSDSHAEKAGEADNPNVEINHNEEEWLDKFPITQENEALDIEEGQILTEEMNENPSDENFGSENVAEIRDDKKKGLLVENATKGNDVGEGYDNSPRILEVMAKMEKRRERFKEPITLKKENELIPKPQVDPIVETIVETQQQRPARKRRWGGS